MCVEGTLRKMKNRADGEVHYWLNLDKEPVLHLNPLIGKSVTLEWLGTINCINCGRETPKSFGQGFCYPCFRDAPEASPCIIRPELCEAHLGKGRDPAWEMANHSQPHLVYLAQTADIKIGITRSTQVPTRWIDQGAWRAVAIAETPYRQLAGVIEMEIKQFLSDRTDWRSMLTGTNGLDDLMTVRDEILSFFPKELEQYIITGSELQEFHYPVPQYPVKVSSINLDKHRKINAVLEGIRGQYLLFSHGEVINLRKYSGYRVRFDTL